MSNIPVELTLLPQWTYSYSLEDKKRPTHTTYKTNGGLTFEEARIKAGEHKFVGLYVTPDDPYFLLDIDGLHDPSDPFAELPLDLSAFLQLHKTYTEVSPSGKGLRAVYKLPKGEDKQQLSGSYTKYKGKMGEGSKGKEREAQLNYGPPWQTVTGNKTEFSADHVAEVQLTELREVFPIVMKQQALEQPKQEFDKTKLPTLSEVSGALDAIPLDQNPRVVRAYEKVFLQKYQHYEFWNRILMAVHHYATLADKDAECLSLVLKWSRKDPTEYESEEDVLKHWRSFNNDTDKEIISYRSLFGVAYRNRLFWPTPKKRSKDEERAGTPVKPIISEYANFQALIDFYNIKLYRDETDPNLIYITGDADIIRQYFSMYKVKQVYGKYWGPFTRDTLIPAFHMMSQEKGFTGASHMLMAGFVKNVLALTQRTIHLVKLYFNTPYHQLPKEYRTDEAYYDSTTFDKLFECLVIDCATVDPDRETELYKAYYRKWLMGLVRNLYYLGAEQMNNCVLLLTGPEQIRKTSHFKFLLPEFMREYIAFTTHGFVSETAMRDVVKLSSTNLVLVWDELEQFLVSGAESNFKKVIDGNPQKIIDKYETIEKLIKPIAIYGATSNKREFNLSSEGSRRLFHIPVKWVHTNRMREINWHRLINELRGEVSWGLKSNQTPWLLTEEQLSYQSDLHRDLRAKTGIDMMLNEVWDFNVEVPLKDGGAIPNVKSVQNDKTGRLLTTTEVKNTLIKAGFNSFDLKLPALTKSLERMCGSYTGTLRRPIELERPRCRVVRGRAEQHQYKKWVLPPMRQEAAANMFKQFEDVM
jgi:hypothetical protein